ncbi:MAG TPA: sialidase family protein [Chthoniobacterales bacterium]
MPNENKFAFTKRFTAVALLAGGLALLCAATGWFAPADRNHGERKETWSGRSFAAQTDVQTHARPSRTAPGWDSERVWSGEDDWEPFCAVDRASRFVYQLTTRFNARVSGIFFRASSDGGETWGLDQLIAPIHEWQADPQIEVAADGTIFVVWLDGPHWTSRLIKSSDHGATWTPPVTIAPSLPWTDHPWLAVSPDGRDVYVGLNEDESFLVASHNGGATFDAPVLTSHTPGHWWDHNGATIAPDGSIYFVAINFFLDYRGDAEISVISSHDKGASWQVAHIDRSAPPPGCNGAPGCEYGFLSSTASLAIDPGGTILLAYSAGEAIKQPEPMWITTSTDGAHWTPRVQVSHPNAAATSGFPAVAAGPVAGDFRVVWQSDAAGDPRGWNTFYRRTTDGGVTWGEITQLSDRTTGAPYKTPAGYLFPYGDYLSLSVDAAGTNHVIWGEGTSYNGPGGVWFTRGPRRERQASASANVILQR